MNTSFSNTNFNPAITVRHGIVPMIRTSEDGQRVQKWAKVRLCMPPCCTGLLSLQDNKILSCDVPARL